MRMSTSVYGLIAALACVWTTACPRYAYLAHRVTPLTSPLPEINDLRSRAELVFVLMGDSGTGDRHQNAVAEGIKAACAATQSSRCDFALLLGDNIYENGVKGVADPSFQTKFKRVYEALGRMDFFVVPGNHDWHKKESVQAQIDYSRDSQQWRMLSNHYAVPRLPGWLTLYGLDTTVMRDLADTSDAAKKAALAGSQKQQFEAAGLALKDRPGWRLLFGHHPVYSSGRQHGYENGNKGVLPSLKDSVEKQVIEPNKVAIYFAAHDHHQELLHSREPDYYQLVQGAGGRLRPVKRRAADGVEQKFACSEYGFALAHASPGSMKLAYFGCGADGRSGACREIYGARLTLAGSGAIGFEQLPAPRTPCQSPATD